MSISRTGNVTRYDGTIDGTWSTSITVPDDAELIVVYVMGWTASAGVFTLGSVTVGGVTCDIEVSADQNQTWYMSAIFALDVRTLRGTRTLAGAWDVNLSQPMRLYYAFYKGCDFSNYPTSVYRDTGSHQAMPDPYFDTVTAQSGDLIVAGSTCYQGVTIGWTNATAVATAVYEAGTYPGAIAYAENASANGSTQIIADWTYDIDGDGGLAIIVLKPAQTADPTVGHIVVDHY